MVIRCLRWPEGGFVAGNAQPGSSQDCFGFGLSSFSFALVTSPQQFSAEVPSVAVAALQFCGHKKQQRLPLSSFPHPSKNHHLPLKISSCWATFVSKPLHLFAETGEIEMLGFYHRKNWGLCRIAGRKRRADGMSVFVLQCLHCFSITEIGAKVVLRISHQTMFCNLFLWMDTNILVSLANLNLINEVAISRNMFVDS